MSVIEDIKITNTTNWRDLPIEKLIAVQKVLDTKKSLTLAEASIYFQLSMQCLRKYIEQGEIITYHPFGAKNVRINMEETKKNFYKMLK